MTRVRHQLVSSLAFLVGTVAACPESVAVPVSAEERGRSEVAAAVTTFLTAFENLDWATFHASFADDVTVFFPTPEPPQRFVGRTAVEAQFERVFQAIRKSAPGGPPYHLLQPQGLSVHLLEPGTALVAFELHNSERIGRRTIVFRRVDGRWKIVHLHASNVPVKQ